VHIHAFGPFDIELLDCELFRKEDLPAFVKSSFRRDVLYLQRDDIHRETIRSRIFNFSFQHYLLLGIVFPDSYGTRGNGQMGHKATFGETGFVFGVTRFGISPGGRTQLTFSASLIDESWMVKGVI
jgi:hypothetical protein